MSIRDANHASESVTHRPKGLGPKVMKGGEAFPLVSYVRADGSHPWLPGSACGKQPAYN